jgi:hypothetical protein
LPRTMRVEYPGAICHVMDRGDRREEIFVDDVDRQDLLKTLAKAGQKTGWQVHGMEVWHLGAPELCPGWVRLDRLLGEHGIGQDSAAGRQDFERQMQARRLEEQNEAAFEALSAWLVSGQ